MEAFSTGKRDVGNQSPVHCYIWKNDAKDDTAIYICDISIKITIAERHCIDSLKRGHSHSNTSSVLSHSLYVLTALVVLKIQLGLKFADLNNWFGVCRRVSCSFK